MNGASIVILILLAAAVYFALRHICRHGGACGGCSGCEHCAEHGHCAEEAQRLAEKADKDAE